MTEPEQAQRFGCDEIYLKAQNARMHQRSLPTNRKRFESWLINQRSEPDQPPYVPAKKEDETYADHLDQCAWLGWQDKELPWFDHKSK